MKTPRVESIVERIHFSPISVMNHGQDVFYMHEAPTWLTDFFDVEIERDILDDATDENSGHC